MRNLHILILAGGSGDRLWPLSSPDRPKQLLPFFNNKTLLDLTIERAQLLAEASNIHIITCEQQALAIKAVAHGRAQIIVEPSQRNTGPAILFALQKLYSVDPAADVLIVPSDSFIDNNQVWVVDLQLAAALAAEHQGLALIGVWPTRPATGYGYIACENFNGSKKAYTVSSFHEKPDLKTATDYLCRKNMLWNTGIVIGSLKAFIEHFQLLAPDLSAAMNEYIAGQRSYESLPAISFDYAVMEKTINAHVVPASFGWSDVGNLRTFLELSQQTESSQGTLFQIKAQNNIAKTLSKPVFCIGVNDLCIIETEDALVVVHENNVEDVRQAVSLFKKNATPKEISF